MKTVILAIVSLILCIAFTCFCGFYITRTVEKTSSALSALPEVLSQDKNTREEALACVNEALFIWKDSKKMTLLGLSHVEYDEVEDLLAEVRVSILSGDPEAASRRSASLKEKLSKISASEGLSLDGVF